MKKNIPYYVSIGGNGEKFRWLHAYLKGISAKCKAHGFVQNLNVGHRFYFQQR